MSDQIPVGSPPAPPGRHAAPSGWYPDPVDPRRERWWDGWQWSRQTRGEEGPPTATEGRTVPPADAPAGYARPTDPSHGVSGANGPQYPYAQGNPQHGGPHAAAYPTTPGKPPALTADGVRLSGWWRRVGAVLIDWVIVSVVGTLILIPIWTAVIGRLQPLMAQMFADAMAGRDPQQPQVTDIYTETDQVTITLVTLAVGLIYHIGLLIWRGQTIGKLACGIKVVPVDDGRHSGGLGWRTAVMRALVWVIPGQVSLLLVVRLLDVLWPLRHPRRQALHDLAAKTQVVINR